MGQWKFSSTFPGLSPRWRWVVSFTLLPFFPQRKNPHHPLDRKLVGPKGRSGRCGEFSCSCQESNPSFLVVQRVAVTIPTELSRLSCTYKTYVKLVTLTSSTDEVWGFHSRESYDIGLKFYGTVSFRRRFTTCRSDFLPQSSEQKWR
jgi:hypothetical protein